MLTVGIDLRGSSPEFKEHFGRGTGRYAVELSNCLLGRSSEVDECRVVPLYLETIAASPWQKKLLQMAPAGRQTLETQLFLPNRFNKLPVDVIHFLAHGDATARCQKPYLLTVLDLIPLRFPELYKAIRPGWRYHLARYFENAAVRRAQGIIAISEATKRDVVQLLGFPEDRVVVTHLGVGDAFQPRSIHWAEEAQATRHQFGLPDSRPLLIYSGGIDPRKNLTFLLKVFREVLDHLPAENRPILGLVGRIQQSDRYPALQSEISELGLKNDIYEIGFVPDADLYRLYCAANIYVFPSLYEGFGLPVLEAMACGVPVVAGNNSSLPEVAGKAAMLLSDNDVSAWALEIISILSSNERQAALAEQGIRQAKSFTWERTAAQTLEAYRYFNTRCGWRGGEEGRRYSNRPRVQEWQ